MPARFWLPLIFTAVFKGFQFSSSLAPNLPNPFSGMEVPYCTECVLRTWYYLSECCARRVEGS